MDAQRRATGGAEQDADRDAERVAGARRAAQGIKLLVDAQRMLDMESELVHISDVVEYALEAAHGRFVAQAQPLLTDTKAYSSTAWNWAGSRARYLD